MIEFIILCFWLICIPMSYFLHEHVFANKYGWGERSTVFTSPEKAAMFCFSICGPISLLVILLSDYRFCFMSKEEALELYDKENFEKYGYYIGRHIAKEEGRLPDDVDPGPTSFLKKEVKK